MSAPAEDRAKRLIGRRQRREDRDAIMTIDERPEPVRDQTGRIGRGGSQVGEAAGQPSVSAEALRSQSSGAVGPFIAVLRRPLLVLLPVLLVIVPAMTFVLTRTPVYTAASQILVGRVDVEASAVPGFVEANQQLAATYARLIGTSVISDRVADAVDVPAKELRGKFQGSPVPESPIIQVEATASTEAEAVALARAAAEQLIAYVLQSNENPARQKQLLDAYGVSAAEQRSLEATRIAAADRLASAQGGERPAGVIAERQRELNIAQAALDEATLRATTSEAAYRDSQRGAADRGALQIIQQAEATGDDRASRLQLALLASVLIGGLLGVALSTLRENRGFLRRQRSRMLVDGRPSR